MYKYVHPISLSDIILYLYFPGAGFCEDEVLLEGAPPCTWDNQLLNMSLIDLRHKEYHQLTRLFCDGIVKAWFVS